MVDSGFRRSDHRDSADVPGGLPSIRNPKSGIWNRQSAPPGQTLTAVNPRPPAGRSAATTTSRRSMASDRGGEVGLGGGVGHHDEGDGGVGLVVLAGVVLDDAGDAHAVLAEDLGDHAEHAGAVGDPEPEVVPAADVLRRAERGAERRPRARGPATVRRGRGPADEHVDQVAEHGRGRRPRAGPPAVEEGVADRRRRRPGSRCTGRTTSASGVPRRTSRGRDA